MRKRTLLKGGGIAVVIGGVALWLSGLLDGLGLGPGFGLGPGGGTGRGTSNREEPSQQSDEFSVSHTDRASIEDGESAQAELRVLEVVVAGDGYEIRREAAGAVQFSPADLSRVKQLAKRTRGTDEGIRVLIHRRESALPDAELALDQALAEAGIQDSEILRREELLPARSR
jgi:hypothetical protein